LTAIKVADGKVKSIDLVMGRGEELRVCMSIVVKNCFCQELG